MDKYNTFIPFSFDGKKVSFTQEAIHIFGKSNNPFIICVYGLPGSGKSSLINRLLTKSYDQGPMVAQDGPKSITTHFNCVGPINISDFQNTWGISGNMKNDYDLFFIDSVGFNAIDSTFEQEKDILYASISISTIASVELWVQKGRSNQVISDVSSHISLSNAIFKQFGKNIINPYVGLIFNDIYSPENISNHVSESTITKSICQSLTQVRDKPFISFQKSENNRQEYMKSLEDVAKYICRKVGGVKYWPNMLCLFNDTSESLKDVKSFDSLKHYSFDFSNVWNNYRKERVNTAEYNTMMKTEELIIQYCERIRNKIINEKQDSIEIMSIVNDIRDKSMEVFFNYIENLNLNDSNEESEIMIYTTKVMKNIKIQIENQAIIKIEGTLFDIGKEICYKLQNLANDVYDQKYPSIVYDIRNKPIEDFKEYTEDKLSEMMTTYEMKANNIYCNSYDSTTVEMIGQQLIFHTAFNMNNEYLLQKRYNYQKKIQEEDEIFKIEVENEKKRYEEEKTRIIENNQNEINEMKKKIEESLNKYQSYIKELEHIMIEEMNEYQTKQLNFKMETIEMRNNIQREHQNQMMNYLIILSEFHSKEYQFLSDQMLASTSLIMETNECQHQMTRILNSYETHFAKNEIIHFTNQRANDIQRLIIQESNNIKILVHEEANRINQNIHYESNLIHKHIENINTIINNHIDHATNEINQNINIVGNGIHQHLNDVDSGIHQHLSAVDSGFHQHLNKVETGLHHHISNVDSGLHQHLNQTENNINHNIKQQSNYIMREIKVNRVNFNQRFDDMKRYNSKRFNQIQKANRYYHHRQMIEHHRTQNQIYEFHEEQTKWNSETTNQLKEINKDLKEGFEIKKEEETSIEPYVGSSFTIGPLTMESENGVGGLQLKCFGGKIGITTDGELRLGYEISGGGSAGVGVEGSMGQDLVFSLFKGPSVETTMKGGITAGAGGQFMGTGLEAKVGGGLKTTTKKKLI